MTILNISRLEPAGMLETMANSSPWGWRPLEQNRGRISSPWWATPAASWLARAREFAGHLGTHPPR